MSTALADVGIDTPILNMQSVVKSFAEKSVLNQLNFSLKHGQVVGLLGRNGAGKSTLIECALGLRNIQAGEISVFGEDPQALSPATRGRIGYVPQKTDLFGWMTAPQMLGFFKAFYPRWNEDKANALLSRWSISQTTLIDKLSGGEKQRLAIIRALAHEPDLLILDEPVSSLDPAGRRDFLRELVDTVIDRSATILFSTHILTDLQRVAVNAAFLHDGRILLQDELDNIAESAVMLTGSHEALMPLAEYLVTPIPHAQIKSDPLNLRLVAQIHPQVVPQILAENPIIAIEHLSLEDFFIEATK
jgi:ABC-2 type transport system ATP-binding protein